MKRIILIFLILAVIPLAFAELDRDCFEDWKQIACGVENFPLNDSFCNEIQLEVLDCYNEGENFYATFTGMEDFQIKELYKGLTFDITSRTKVWKGSMAITNPEEEYDILPEGAIISREPEGTYLFYAPIGNYSITGFQVTVPYCYRIEDSDNQKAYPRTQAGKTCEVRKKEVKIELISSEPEQETSSADAEKTPEQKADWSLFLTIIVVVILTYLLFKPRKKLKKGKN
ncbi:hypothetical protein KY308_02770 [Candidatus Woesearchaeota archaeon]|nr:hypothetical protein [Candidatus Woesearchaeota archaeon]